MFWWSSLDSSGMVGMNYVRMSYNTAILGIWKKKRLSAFVNIMCVCVCVGVCVGGGILHVFWAKISVFHVMFHNLWCYLFSLYDTLMTSLKRLKVFIHSKKTSKTVSNVLEGLDTVGGESSDRLCIPAWKRKQLFSKRDSLQVDFFLKKKISP